MFACPNCGGNLKFHIPSQQLACEYCNTQADPYSFEDKNPDLIEKKEYEVTVFTCPQCGGEILSTDTSAAEFCSFCGASTILHSRMINEKRPNFIIPFKQTKEDCKNAYAKMMKKAIFAPDDLKDPKRIDSFRGIYIPYWAFYLTQQNQFSLRGIKSHRRGDYIIKDHYSLKGTIDAYYKGLSYDASSSFDDNISEAIAPYDVKGMKAFTPSYLSGFYADTPDVSAHIYETEAHTLASQNSMDKICSTGTFSGYGVRSNNSSDAVLTTTERIDNAMFPVWFMSYRNGSRVAYATVNGQTGKVAADLPVDPKKYVVGSLILAIPLFIFLNLFFTVIPSTLLMITGIIALFVNILYTAEINTITKKERGITDKGRISKETPELLHQSTAPKKKTNRALLIMGICIALSIILPFLPLLSVFLEGGLVWILLLFGGCISTIIGVKKRENLKDKKKSIGFMASILAMAIGTAISLLHPVSDIFYYGGAILSLLAVFFTIKDIMFYYNILSTRRLPQFDRTGGDDRA